MHVYFRLMPFLISSESLNLESNAIHDSYLSKHTVPRRLGIRGFVEIDLAVLLSSIRSSIAALKLFIDCGQW